MKIIALAYAYPTSNASLWMGVPHTGAWYIEDTQARGRHSILAGPFAAKEDAETAINLLLSDRSRYLACPHWRWVQNNARKD